MNKFRSSITNKTSQSTAIDQHNATISSTNKTSSVANENIASHHERSISHLTNQLHTKKFYHHKDQVTPKDL